MDLTVASVDKKSERDEMNDNKDGEEEKPLTLSVLEPPAPDTVDLDLNHHRIGKIENLDGLGQLETLCLRWNLIKKIENLSMLSTLRELELYDNQITVIENLNGLMNLE